MADNKIWLWLIAIIAVIVVGMYIQKQYEIFATLPVGQYNGYPDKTICTYTTNVDPVTSVYTGYDNSAAWIAIDINNDGIKEAFGRYSNSVGTGNRACACGGACATGKSSSLLIENYNTGGDDIYSYNDGTITSLTVCASSGYSFNKHQQNYGAASNAVLTCGGITTCTSGQTQACTASNGCTGTQSCSSNAWGTCTTTLIKCTDGSCQASCGGTQTCLLTDTNGNSKVDDNELLSTIQRWVVNL